MNTWIKEDERREGGEQGRREGEERRTARSRPMRNILSLWTSLRNLLSRRIALAHPGQAGSLPWIQLFTKQQAVSDVICEFPARCRFVSLMMMSSLAKKFLFSHSVTSLFYIFCLIQLFYPSPTRRMRKPMQEIARQRTHSHVWTYTYGGPRACSYIYMQIPVKIVLIIRHEDGNHVHVDPWPCHHVVSLKGKLGKASPELVAAQLTCNMIFSYSPSVYNNILFF